MQQQKAEADVKRSHEVRQMEHAEFFLDFILRLLRTKQVSMLQRLITPSSSLEMRDCRSTPAPATPAPNETPDAQPTTEEAKPAEEARVLGGLSVDS